MSGRRAARVNDFRSCIVKRERYFVVMGCDMMKILYDYCSREIRASF